MGNGGTKYLSQLKSCLIGENENVCNFLAINLSNFGWKENETIIQSDLHWKIY